MATIKPPWIFLTNRLIISNYFRLFLINHLKILYPSDKHIPLFTIPVDWRATKEIFEIWQTLKLNGSLFCFHVPRSRVGMAGSLPKLGTKKGNCYVGCIFSFYSECDGIYWILMVEWNLPMGVLDAKKKKKKNIIKKSKII